MADAKPLTQGADVFSSFADVLKEMVNAGYGLNDVVSTLKDLGLSEREAKMLVELNVEKQLPLTSGKIESMVRKKIESNVQALRLKLKRHVQSRKRRQKAGLEMVYDALTKVLDSEIPERAGVFEKRYYNYLLLSNQAEIERKELVAFLLELKDLKLSRKARARISTAIDFLQDW
ncbi:MAG: hypothetical protein J4478_01655 [Candidatus Diapherotrites archaeon]|uniref:NADP-dependent isocitrate dehydrogenase n=1 Tax=Candidatus Iainarchaeum sp. TaxID=3101447 RepID=A0A7J4JWJ1_9ARCH|nr:hypothetical protein [Candidatus Diapherotrites archaeon]HIH21350.1 NADP-dependent isocitrate dehydrogenase [Candidatus Diapherotrites archaeon]HIH33007.1 NADP-dependent isocitrate dehydrogenase [Candidatus Diapherotrites archaeon]